MKKIVLLIGVMILMLSFAGSAVATLYTFEPDPANIYNLNHKFAYTWGIDWTLAPGEEIRGATITFERMRNWDTNPNDLFVHLLDSAPSGITKVEDNPSDVLNGDYFAGQGILFYEVHNVPNTFTGGDGHGNYVHSLTSAELITLMTYVSDGNFGIGFDPDCEYFNRKITFNTRTGVPEPGTLMLLGAGLVGAAFYARRRKN